MKRLELNELMSSYARNSDRKIGRLVRELIAEVYLFGVLGARLPLGLARAKERKAVESLLTELTKIHVDVAKGAAIKELVTRIRKLAPQFKALHRAAEVRMKLIIKAGGKDKRN